MLVNKFAQITEKGWEKLYGIIDYEKLDQALEGFSPLERVLVIEVLTSNMEIRVTMKNAKEYMEDYIKQTEEPPTLEKV